MPDLPTDASAPIDKVTDERAVDAKDSGWTVESQSTHAPAPPDDTTLESLADESVSEQAPEQRQAQRATPPAAGTPAQRPKKKQTFQERIDELTKRNSGTKSELEKEQQKTRDLEARIQALEKGATAAPAKPAADDAAARAAAEETAKKAAADALPEPPKYVDYDTDDDYNRAVAKWRGDVDAWTTKREARLRDEIVSGVDAKLTQKDRDAEVAQREAEIVGKISKAREDHPDFMEKVEANADVFKQIRHPFIQDIVVNTGEGGEFLYDLVSDPELAVSLAELPLPTRPLADAVRTSPAARQIMKYFASDEGRDAFMKLRLLHPVRVLAEVGKLEARLESADSGSDRGARRPITNAVPPARPPVGSPRARAPQGSSGPPANFEDWMAEEDAAEVARKQRAAGVAAPA